MDTKAVIEIVESVVAPIVGDYVKELRILGERVEHMQRQITLLKTQERGRRNRELVRATEADDDDDY